MSAFPIVLIVTTWLLALALTPFVASRTTAAVWPLLALLVLGNSGSILAVIL